MNVRRTTAVLISPIAILVLLLAINPANAQFNWVNTTDINSEWGVGTNWSPYGPPGPVDGAEFNSSDTYQVSAWGDYGVKFLSFTDGNVSLSSQNDSLYQITVFGDLDGQLSDLTISGPDTELTVRGLRLRSNGGAQIIDDATLTLDGSHAAGAFLSVAEELKVGGNLNVLDGAIVSNHIGSITGAAGSTSTVTVSGVGSQWNNSSLINIGAASNNGILNVSSGGVVSSASARIGHSSDGTGIVTVSGPGSQWNSSSDFEVGSYGNGSLNVESGGVVSTYIAHIARYTGSTGVATVTGAGSQWNTYFDLNIGGQGNGTLNVAAGGVVSNAAGIIGVESGSTGQVSVMGAGSQWNNSSAVSVGNSGIGTMNIESGGVVSNSIGYIGQNTGSTGSVTVTGSDSQWNNSSSLYAGYSGHGTMNVESGGVVSNSIGYVGRNSGATGSVTVTGPGSQWNNSSASYIGYSGHGTMNVESGGVVSNTVSYIGRFSTGTVAVTGGGSQWNNSSSLFVGGSGDGTLSVGTGGVVTDTNGYVGWGFGSTGLASVSGQDSQWNHSGEFNIGYTGNGTVNVSSGGVVTNGLNGYIGTNPGATGTVTVVGTGSQWNNSNDLFVGGYHDSAGGTGTLNINNGGLVTVGGTTGIWSTGTVNLNGGRFEFGETTMAEFSSINGVSGSMAGNLNHSGYTHANTLTALQNPSVDLTDVTLTNSGTLYGNASLGCGLINTVSGEVEINTVERMRFAGTGNTNAGELNNFGGIARFEHDMANLSGGFINGRGQFIANGGWNNTGVMAFSGGTADILGDVDNGYGGQIVTSGNATTTFFDDVIHNGLEIRTAAGSNTVFFGATSGSGAFTGTGTVFFEGDLRPGNSPDIVSFEGGVVMGSLATLNIELSGELAGDFDRLEITGDLFLDGDLSVELIDGFHLLAGQQFMVADIGGDLFGQFNGLGENDWVGNFGGRDLFVTYTAGNGNDIVLFTTVPEPGTAGLVAVLGIVMNLRRRRPTKNPRPKNRIRST